MAMNNNMTLDTQLEIIKRFQTEPPVHVVPIAEALGLEVFKVPGWPDNLSGMIRKEEDSCNIYVNASHHIHRRRFTIAHEIAHFILHKDLIGDGIADDALYRSNLSNKIEAQANSFAADILMPWHLLNPLLAQVDNISTLAELFHVSKSAMSIRLGFPYEINEPECIQTQAAAG
jgi:Zn-dependent peptidase ImmA (M78 family)